MTRLRLVLKALPQAVDSGANDCMKTGNTHRFHTVHTDPRTKGKRLGECPLWVKRRISGVTPARRLPAPKADISLFWVHAKGTKLWAGDCVGSELRGSTATTETQALPEQATAVIPPDQKE